MEMNMNKTKVILSGESCKGLQDTAIWPCDVSGRDIGRNLVQSANCQGVQCYKGSMIKVSMPCVCRGYTDQATSVARRTSVHIDGGACLELLALKHG